ncbi:hypothetical protein BDV98DRAFT_605511 [Pterulicium gracile]|uniref:Uncharacterized protein n=1 Tax=Pterulicium gracile TaxID=1884261 RepID=A0A5C3QHR3_9AGAR|nr:hypothetical protein BDV98DRAFT_605511 [Pterula gracilis]
MGALHARSSSESSLTLTAEDLEKVRTFGRALNNRVSYVVGEWTLYSLYLVLCATAMSSIFKPARHSCRMRLLLSTLFVSFVLITMLCCSDLATLHEKITIGLIDHQVIKVADRFSLVDSTVAIQLAFAVRTIAAGAADMGILFHIADVLAAWRAVVIWNTPSRRIVAVLLCFLIFSSFTLYVPYVVLAYQSVTVPSGQAFPNTSPMALLAIVSSLLSIMANIMATTMIGITAYRQVTLETSSRVRLSSSRILTHLTESGLFYALLQIARLALTVSVVPSTPRYSTLDTAQRVFQRGGAIVTAMYPPALILIVNHGCSVADTFYTATQGAREGTPLQTISLDMSFARHSRVSGETNVENFDTPSTARGTDVELEKVRES